MALLIDLKAAVADEDWLLVGTLARALSRADRAISMEAEFGPGDGEDH